MVSGLNVNIYIRVYKNLRHSDKTSDTQILDIRVLGLFVSCIFKKIILRSDTEEWIDLITF